MNKELLNKAKSLFFIALAIDLVASLINGFNSYSSLSTFREVQQGLIQIDQSIIDSINSRDMFSKITVLTAIGVGLALVKWLNASYQFARTELGAIGFKYDGWTTWGWIVPIWNMFRPYQIINEIYKAGSSQYNGGDDWKRESGSGVLLTWWILWALTHLVAFALSKQILIKSLEPSIPEAIDSLNFVIGFSVFSAVIVIFWYLITEKLTQRLLDRSEKSSYKPDNNARAVQAPQQTITRPVFTANMPFIKPIVTKSIHSEKQAIASHISIENIEDHFYEIVANELEAGIMQKGLWTKLYAQCGGDEVQIKVRYIEQRVAQLKDAEKQQQEDAKLADQELQELAKREQQKIDSVESDLDMARYLSSERDRLLALLVSPIYFAIAELESYKKADPYNLNDEPRLKFIRLLGGRAIPTKSFLGEISFKVELNGESLILSNRHTFNDWIFKVLIPRIKSAEEFPLEKLQKMESLGITYDGSKYHLKDYTFSDFKYALSFAEQQTSKY